MWFCQMLEHAASIEKLVSMVLLHTETWALMDVLDYFTDWTCRTWCWIYMSGKWTWSYDQSDGPDRDT